MNDLIKIKKYYGEQMMHLCRELFPTILEQDNLLFSLLDSNFAHSKFLYDDIIEEKAVSNFRDYIYSLTNIEKVEKIEVTKTPKELLDEAGYILYECHSEKDIQQFKKYYSKGEELCTFNSDRLKKCYVFFAIKKNVNKIKRENFPNPKRQDEYGTSVISIQFSRGKVNTLSIKNRYNHTVSNPDTTFLNNLENIIPGLTKSFEKEYNLKINQHNNIDFELLFYVKAKDGKYYKYNHEINNIYYCPNNIIIDNFEVKMYEPEKYLVIDYFILDLVNKKIYLYDDEEKDSFIDGLENIKKIEITKLKESKMIKLIFDNFKEAYIEINKYNNIISYTNNFLTTIGNFFLYENVDLKKIDLPNVKEIGNYFLTSNKVLSKINIQNTEKIADNFLYHNEELKELNIPKIAMIGKNFLYFNVQLQELNISNVEKINKNFLYCNIELKELNILKVTKIEKDFLPFNERLQELNIPNVKVIENNFLYNNQKLKKINAINVITIKDGFLYNNKYLEKIELPNVIEIGDYFLKRNEILTKIDIKKVETLGDDFLFSNNNIKKIDMPNLINLGNNFFCNNQVIEEINIPIIKNIGICFLIKNKKISRTMVLKKKNKIGDELN